MTLDNFTDRTTLMLTTNLLKWLTYQLSMVRSKLTMVVTGNGESVFDSGEGALETATTSKEGSRRANYPLSARGGSDEK